MMLLLSSLVIGFAHAQASFKIAKYGTTPHGFNSPARGWNSWGAQENYIVEGWGKITQALVEVQCDKLASSPSKENGFIYCSVDSGWSEDYEGDEYGRLIGSSSFDVSGLATHLHDQGLKLGLYVVPGAFQEDVKNNKKIMGTDVLIGDVCQGDEGLARCIFDYSQEATQTWHDSVVQQFADWGVDFIKLDYITPGSVDNGQNLPEDQSDAVVAWSKAIDNSGADMRLHISWKLDRTKEYFPKWNAYSDAMRTDQDINNSDSETFVAWGTVQRAVENYRQWILAGLGFFDTEINTYPDLDNLYIANEESISGISNSQRQTMYSHWILAGAGLMLGSDLTRVDDYGNYLLSNKAALDVAQFASFHPMQPRNPGTGGQNPAQVQAWVAGPDGDGNAVVLLANYGPDQGQGGWGSDWTGKQELKISWAELGLEGKYTVHDVWNDSDWQDIDEGLSVGIDEGTSYLLRLWPV